MTHHSASSDLNNNAVPSSAPARRWAKRSKFTKSAAAAAVVLMAGAGTVAVAQAATTGSATSSKTAAASSLAGHRRGHPGPRGMWGHGTPPAAAGTVASVGTGTFTLNARDGTTVTVDVTSSTTYKDPAVTSPSLADVTVGEMVSVEGTTASGIVTATSVLIGSGFGGGTWGHGLGQGPAAAGSAS